MPIFRSHTDSNYTVIPNKHLFDSNLSLDAKGLYSIMLSFPGQLFPMEWIKQISCDSAETIQAALDELKEKGYVEEKE